MRKVVSAAAGMACMLLMSIAGMGQIKGDPPLKQAPGIIPLQKSTLRLSPVLQQLSNYASGRSMPMMGGNAVQSLLQFSDDRHLLVDIITDGDTRAAAMALQRLGFAVTGVAGRMISGYAVTDSLITMAQSPFVHFIKPAYRPVAHHVGAPAGIDDKKPAPVVPVTGQGDTAQGSWLARRKYKVEGRGIKVGILSDSYNSLGGAATGISGAELPGPANPLGYRTPVEVLQDLAPGAGSDEGRALAEIVHDVAPAAHLAFHTANAGEANFAQGIADLVNAGCQVITDDILYYDEPFFSDGIITQAINKARDAGVFYFTAAGNQSNRSYESIYRSSTDAVLGADKGTAHNFSGDTTLARYYQPVFIPTGVTTVISLQWDQSFFSAGGAGAVTDMDIYLINGFGEVVAAGISDNLISGDPVEIAGFTNLTSDNVFFIVIVKHAGTDPGRLKYVLFNGGGFFETNPPIPGLYAPTLVGHSKADGAITVAAAAWYNTPGYGKDTAVAESFSSLGGVADYFDNHGNRLTGRIPQKPDITAPDGVNTSFFAPAGAGDIIQDTDNFPNFFGTSAATPHAAGVAALMLEAEKLHRIRPAELKGILAATASDMDNSYTPGFDKGFDFQTGFGFIQAAAAVAAVKFPAKYIRNLELEAVCPQGDPETTRSWRISNMNPFPVEVSWMVPGTRLSGKIEAAPGYTYFNTSNTPAGNHFRLPRNVMILWDDNLGCTRLAIAAVKNLRCATGEERIMDTAAVDTEPVWLSEVYPNPSHNQFRLYLSLPGSAPVMVQVFSADGRMVMNQRIGDTKSVVTINAESWRAGIYLLNVRQGVFSKTIRLVRQ